MRSSSQNVKVSKIQLDMPKSFNWASGFYFIIFYFPLASISVLIARAADNPEVDQIWKKVMCKVCTVDMTSI